jgi:hypothetical protein
MDTAVRFMLKELQEKFPKEMKDMYENNQLLFDDIVLKSEKKHEQEIENALQFGWSNMTPALRGYYKKTFKQEENGTQTN